MVIERTRRSKKKLSEEEILRLRRELFRLCIKILRKHRRIILEDYKRWKTLAGEIFER